MCPGQVHTGAYVSLLAPGKTDYSGRPRFKDTLLKSTPHGNDTKNGTSTVPRRCENLGKSRA